MGRVYDALKRAESAQRPFKPSQSSIRRNGNADNVAYFHPRNGDDHPWEGSPFTGMPAANNSAFTAHTTEATGGPALPAGPPPLAARHTLHPLAPPRPSPTSHTH